MKKVLALAFVAVLVSVSAASFAAQPTNVLLNGQLVSPWNTTGNPSLDPANHPYNWDYYNLGQGGAGLGVKYDTNKNYVLRYENGDSTQSGSYYYGHSVIFGGSPGTSPSQYGIRQTINTTPGKLYWFVGNVQSSNAAGINFDYGLQQGNVAADVAPTSHVIATANTKSTGSSAYWIGNGQMKYIFSDAMIATGNQMTVHAGMRDNDNTATGINAYVDGLRVFEMDIPVNSDLVNGGFDNAVTDVGTANWGTDSLRKLYVHDGWLSLGWGTGNVFQISSATDTIPGKAASSVLALDENQGAGRNYQIQRINKGAGTYSVSADMATWDLIFGDARIGIDFSGGLDPNAASVVWSDALTVASTNSVHTWQSRLVSGEAGANGITIFLASGNRTSVPAFNATSGVDAAISGMSYFDNISLNFVAAPEPSSMLALASGLLGMAGFVVRRRK